MHVHRTTVLTHESELPLVLGVSHNLVHSQSLMSSEIEGKRRSINLKSDCTMREIICGVE